MARYEELRQQVLCGVASGLGHALLLRQGLRAWMEAWSRCTTLEPAHNIETSRPSEILPAPSQAEAVALLATLVLGARGYAQP